MRKAIIIVVALSLVLTGCEVARTEAETARVRAEAERATAQGNADAARIEAETRGEAAILAAEKAALEAEAATTEALAALEQAQGDRTVKEAVAAQVDKTTEVLAVTAGTLRTLSVAVVALVVIFSLGVGGLLLLGWRAQVAQAPGPRYVLVQDSGAVEVLGRGRETALVPASLRPIERGQSRRRRYD